MTGRTISVEIEETDTISQLKQAIQDKEGIPVEQQRIIHAGKQLNNSRILKNFGFKRNVGPTLVIKSNNNGRGRGAAGPRANNGRGRGAAARPNGMYQIFVRTLLGRTIRVEVANSSTIGQLKQAIYTKEGIPVEHQRIILGGNLLNNTRTIDRYDLQRKGSPTLVIESDNNGRDRGAAGPRANNGRGHGAAAPRANNGSLDITKFKSISNGSNLTKASRDQIQGMIDMRMNRQNIVNIAEQNGFRYTGGAKRKPTTKKKVRKIHKGPRGGKYYISKGRKVYI